MTSIQPMRFSGRFGAVVCTVMLLASCGGNSGVSAHAVGGTVSGLSGTLVLQNNAGDDLTLKVDGTFTFPKAVTAGSTYQVSVRTQPLWQNCSVSHGSGNALGNAGPVAVVCSAALARVSSLAGSGARGFGDGSASTASFDQPAGMVVKPDGSLLVADSRSGRVRSVSREGEVTTIAGGGPGVSTNANGLNASFIALAGLALDSAGNVYATEYPAHLIRKITPSADVTTFAGTGLAASTNGPIGSAEFNAPTGIAVSAAGELYVLETRGHAVRKIKPGGDVSTLAGSGVPGFADGAGLAASFNHALGLALDKVGNIYVADSVNQRIRKITPDGTVTTLAGSGVIGTADGVGVLASFSSPSALAVDDDGNLYVVEAGTSLLRMVTPAGVVSTLAGGLIAPVGGVDGIGAAARFDQPLGVVIGADGSLYVADTTNNKIRKVTPVRTP